MRMTVRYRILQEAQIAALPAVDAGARGAVEEFLAHEAALLSTRDYVAWAALLCEDIRYVVPRRVARKRGRGEPEFEPAMAHFDDDVKTLAIRVKRLVESTALWAEDPPSRVRYHVSGLRVRRDPSGLLCAVYDVLIFRARGDKPDYDLISGQRQDLLRETSAGLRLASRVVLLDHTTIGAHNLSFMV
ncbi:aromatic-ring-hydroxylating dioxygenase subunit beta [Immundisolibacter sp.]